MLSKTWSLTPCRGQCFSMWGSCTKKEKEEKKASFKNNKNKKNKSNAVTLGYKGISALLHSSSSSQISYAMGILFKIKEGGRMRMMMLRREKELLRLPNRPLLCCTVTGFGVLDICMSTGG